MNIVNIPIHYFLMYWERHIMFLSPAPLRLPALFPSFLFLPPLERANVLSVYEFPSLGFIHVGVCGAKEASPLLYFVLCSSLPKCASAMCVLCCALLRRDVFFVSRSYVTG